LVVKKHMVKIIKAKINKAGIKVIFHQEVLIIINKKSKHMHKKVVKRLILNLMNGNIMKMRNKNNNHLII